MHELTLIQIRGEALAEVWSSLQWWASVSFGLIALSAFGRERLILPLTIGVSLVYTAFTGYTLLNVGTMMTVARGAVAELAALGSSGGPGIAATRVVEYWQGTGAVNGAILVLCFAATYLGTLAYLWYACRAARQSKTWSILSIPEAE